MILTKEQISGRLYLIFHNRLVRMWQENPPIRMLHYGEPCLESRLSVAHKWKEYLEGTGAIVAKWNKNEATDDEKFVIFNPCESPDDFHKKVRMPTNILLPCDLGLKILALGGLP